MKHLINETEAAEYMAVSVKTLQSWRHRWVHHREGPQWLKVGRAVRYRVGDIESYLRRCEAPSRRAS